MLQQDLASKIRQSFAVYHSYLEENIMHQAMHVFRLLCVVIACTLSPVILGQSATQAGYVVTEQASTQIYDQQGPRLINGYEDIDSHPVNFAFSFTDLMVVTDVGGGGVLATTTAIGHAKVDGPITLHGRANSHVRPSPTDYSAGLNGISGASAYYQDTLYAASLVQDAQMLDLIDAWGIALRVEGKLSILGLGAAQTHVLGGFGKRCSDYPRSPLMGVLQHSTPTFLSGL